MRIVKSLRRGCELVRITLPLRERSIWKLVKSGGKDVVLWRHSNADGWYSYSGTPESLCDMKDVEWELHFDPRDSGRPTFEDGYRCGVADATARFERMFVRVRKQLLPESENA